MNNVCLNIGKIVRNPYEIFSVLCSVVMILYMLPGAGGQKE